MSIDILLSIIIVVKLPCKYFQKSLLSLLDQDLSGAEVVIVATDELSEEENDTLLLLGVPFKVVVRVPAGVFDAMNHALKISAGKYVYFLGSGDTLISGRVKVIIELLGSTKESILIFKVVMPSGLMYPPFCVSRKNLESGVMPCHQGVVISRTLTHELLGFDPRYPITSDFDQLIRATRRNAQIQNFDICIAHYLGGGMSNNGALGEQFMILWRNHLCYNALRFMIVELVARFYRNYIKSILPRRKS